MEKILENILNDYQLNKVNIISILQDIENSFGYIPEEAVTVVFKKT